jgi:hypothetical protein
VFTLSVLIGLVVTIYAVLPARHNVLVTAAIEHHRNPELPWDLDAPSPAELRAWAIGVVGKDVPLPAETAHVIGARRVEVLKRGAALMRLRVGADEVTYLVQNVHGIAPEHAEQHDGDLRATAWRRGKFTCVAVGPSASAGSWLSALLRE